MNQMRLNGFRPEQVAHYEAAGWRAYYDRAWVKAFLLMVRLNREEFRMPFMTAVAGAVERLLGLRLGSVTVVVDGIGS